MYWEMGIKEKIAIALKPLSRQKNSDVSLVISPR